MHVVNRANSELNVQKIKFNEAVLRVRATSIRKGSAQAFEVAPVEASELPVETPVVFEFGNGETRELLVRVVPVKSP